MFRVVDGVMDNMDRKMVEIHGRKIECARGVCPSLYEGFAPLREDGFDSVPGSGLVDPAALTAAYERVYASRVAAPSSADEDPCGGVEDVD
jgi:hypothetical protein